MTALDEAAIYTARTAQLERMAERLRGERLDALVAELRVGGRAARIEADKRLAAIYVARLLASGEQRRALDLVARELRDALKEA